MTAALITLLSLAGAAPGSDPVDAEPSPEPPASTAAPTGTGLQAGGPVQVRLEGDAWLGTSTTTGRVGVALRANLWGPLALRLAPRLEASSMQLDHRMSQHLGSEITAITGQGAQLSVGVGARWTSQPGGEVMVWAGPVVRSHAASRKSFDALADDGFILAPSEQGIGAALGGLGVAPLGRLLSLRGDLELRYLHRAVGSSYLSGHRASVAEGNGPLEWTRDELAVVAGAELRIHPVPALAVALGSSLEVTGGGQRSADSFLRPRLSVGYRF